MALPTYNLWYATDDKIWTDGAGGDEITQPLAMVMRQDATFVVRFTTLGVVVNLGTVTAWEVNVKRLDDFGGEDMIYTTSVTPAGSGAGTTYTFAPDCGGAELVTAMGKKKKLSCAMQIDFTISGKLDKTSRLAVEITNDYAFDSAPPTPVTDAFLRVNKTSGVITGPVDAATFAAANGLGGGAGATSVATVLKTNGTQTAHAPYYNTNEARGAALVLARDAVLAGEVVALSPGGFDVIAPLSREGAAYLLSPGTSILFESNTEVAPFEFAGGVINGEVTGDGDIVVTVSATNALSPSAVISTAAGGVVGIRTRDILVDCPVDPVSGQNLYGVAVAAPGGQFTFKGRNLIVSGEFPLAYGIAWQDGALSCQYDVIRSNYVGAYSLHGTPGEDCYIKDFDELQGDHAALWTTHEGGSDGTDAWWLIGATARGGRFSVWQTGLTKTYVIVAKQFGAIFCDIGGGLLYDESTKISATEIGTGGHGNLLDVLGDDTDAKINIGHWDCAGFGGDTMTVRTGKVEITGQRFRGIATAKGLEISGGVVTLINCTIDTSLNSSTNPITKSGGKLILIDCIIIAHPSRQWAAAATPQTIYCNPGTCVYGVDAAPPNIISSPSVSYDPAYANF